MTTVESLPAAGRELTEFEHQVVEALVPILTGADQPALLAIRVAAAIDAARTQQRPYVGLYVPAGERRRRAALIALRGKL